MVVKGRGSYVNHKKRMEAKKPDRPSPTPLIGKISSLKKMESRDQALHIMHDLAKIAAPIMSHYGFKVGLLCEMFPKNPNLLGLNVNFGQKICIRLRPNHNENWFLPMEELIGTLLHELTHNKIGPHDQRFYKLLDELKEKYYEIQSKGSYSATGYLFEENSLGGGRNVSNIRESRLRKLSEIKYVAKTAKLGSNTNRDSVKGKTPRELMLEAAERRSRDCKMCPSEQSQTDIIHLIPNDAELDIVELTDDDDDDGDEDDIKEVGVRSSHDGLEVVKTTRPVEETTQETEIDNSKATKGKHVSTALPKRPVTFRIPLSKIPKTALINTAKPSKLKESSNKKRTVIELLSDNEEELESFSKKNKDTPESNIIVLD